MGSRADFYIGTEPSTMKYLGSIAWNGYNIDQIALEPRHITNLSELPDNGSVELFRDDDGWYFWSPSIECTVEDYEQRVRAFIASRDDGSLPERDGWPWPWETSATTDCVYTWSDGRILSARGNPERWLEYPPEPNEEIDEYIGIDSAPLAQFPDMSGLQRVTYGKRSGLITVVIP